MTWPDVTERSAIAAYEIAGIGPADLDLVEQHDAFAIAEFLHDEAYWQLTGAAGALQVLRAQVALAHTTGGIYGLDNGACSIHILTAED